LQKDVDTIVTGLSILAGFTPNGAGAGVAFFNSVEKGDYAGAIGSAVSAILGGIDLPVTDAFSSLIDLAQTMRDLTSNPETGAANYTETEMAFISMVAVEQAFSAELVAKFKEKEMSLNVNYNYTRGNEFIMDIDIVVPYTSKLMNDIIQEVRNSNVLYQGIVIDRMD
jgi:hypothetical protein